jgi:hypothetical protein
LGQRVSNTDIASCAQVAAPARNDAEVNEMSDIIRRLLGRTLIIVLLVALTTPVSAFAAGTAWGEPSGETNRTMDPDACETGEPLQTRDRDNVREDAGGDAQQSKAMAQSGLSAQRRAQVKSRVQDRLRERARRFDASIDALEARIARIEAIAERVEQAGGDASGVFDLLDDAKELIGEARTLEAEAAELFRSIADSDDPRATFEEARDTAIAAVRKLRDARAKVTSAIRVLLGVVAGLAEAE